IGTAALSDELLDAADLSSVDVAQPTPHELLDANLASITSGVRHSRAVGAHDHGILQTIVWRSHCSSAMIGVLFATMSRRNEGSSIVMRDIAMRIGTPRPSPSLASRRAAQLPNRRLSRRAAVIGPTSIYPTRGGSPWRSSRTMPSTFPA